MRVVRRVVPLAVLVVVVAAVALVLAVRPDLDDAREEARRRWDALESPLDDRYAALGAVTARVRDAGGPAADIASDVDDELRRWQALRRADAPADDAVVAANELEALTRRLTTAVRASPRLSADAELVAALDLFAAGVPPEPVRAFDDAVRAYAQERSGTLRGLVADVFGYDAVPALDVPEPPEEGGDEDGGDEESP
jgi:hypothetical protein